MIGVNAVPPIPPRLETVKHPPWMSAILSLPSRADAESRGGLARDLRDAFFIHVVDHRHDQALGRVGCKAEMEIFFQDQVRRHRARS